MNSFAWFIVGFLLGIVAAYVTVEMAFRDFNRKVKKLEDRASRLMSATDHNAPGMT